MVLGWRHSSEESAQERGVEPRVSAGKVTLTRVLYRRAEPGERGPSARAPSAEPARGAAGPDPFDFSAGAMSAPVAPGGELEQARAGFAGAATDFPYRELIEHSFGRPLPATAHVGPQAAQACTSLGAEGYALGNQVAFASAHPSLAVAAHEAAHVMQATSGVELYGGESAFEAHADAVAERVVRGESAADLLGGGPAAGAAVRKQTVPGGASSTQSVSTQGAQGSGAQGEQRAAASQTAQQRMSAAIARGELPAVVALVRELRQPQAQPSGAQASSAQRGSTQPQAQPGSAQAQPGSAQAQPATQDTQADVQAALTSARHWMMAQVAATRDRFAAELATAGRDPAPASDATAQASGPGATGQSSGASTAPSGQASASSATSQGQGSQHAAEPHGRGHRARPAAPPPPPSHTTALEEVETRMDTACTPFLDGLQQGDPETRYQHPDAAITEKVFAAVRLHSMRRGVAQIGHRDAAEAEARAHGGVATEAWCGAFAYTQAEQGGGFDRRWMENMQGEGGIRSALAYGGTMARTWVWADGHWVHLREYHRSRGSERWYETVRRAPPSRGIQAGDLVLIDNALGTNPDHITTAISFDGRYLTTVGGNQGSGEQGVSRSREPFDLLQNPEPNDVRALDDAGHPTREARHGVTKHVRVHGVGRWSVVDYERRLYRLSDHEPTEPPTPQELARQGRP